MPLKIRQSIRISSEFDIDDRIEAVISKLQKAKTQYEKEGWSNIHLELEEGDYTENRYVYLKGDRMETEEEMIKRELREAAIQTRRDEDDRETYEALRAKFENK
jgi:biotin-(acetyl-CoA carboxylase) ligase